MSVVSPLVASAALGVSGAAPIAWEELSVRLAVRTVNLVRGGPSPSRAPLNAEARVSRAVRTIDEHPDAAFTLERLAAGAGLSPFHFLRTFRHLTGVTPYQYVMRVRLREAALRLVTESRNVLDVALDCGFGDVSNFNRAFRTEFGVTPMNYRRAMR